jgi:GNAT superfamily N-acetyltransferase
MRRWINLAESLTAFENTPFFKDWLAYVEQSGGEYFGPGQYQDYPFYWGAHPADNTVILKFDGGNTVELQSIRVAEAHRRGGAGTKLLTALCDIADKNHVTLILVSDETNDVVGDDPEEGDDDFWDYDEREHWLQTWYSKFGFDYTGDTSDYGPWMRRDPQ